jgi:predicted outer membrane protein
MKRIIANSGLAVLLLLASAGSARAQTFSEEDLAATIAYDSGHPEEGYLEYARSLARTLSMLNQNQVGKVFKGRGPLRKAEIEAAKLARKAQQESSGDGNGNRKK